MKSYLFSFLLGCLPLLQYGQAEFLQRDLVWFNPRVEIGLGESDQLIVEMEYRTFVFPTRLHQLIIPSITYAHKLNAKWAVGGGAMQFMAYQPGNPYVETEQVITEWRSHVEVSRFDKKNHGEWAQRIQIEQRLFVLEDGNLFAIRPRYLLEYRYPFLWNSRKHRLRASAEPMWNFAKVVPFGHFDQVRLRLLWQLPSLGALNFEFGYMYWLQQSVEASQYLSHHIIPLHITLKI